MLNEKKVKLMTKIAINEKYEGKDIEIASKFFKVDYVTIQMLYTAVATTIAYVLMVLLYALGHLEELLVNTDTEELSILLSSVKNYYILCLGIFLVIALVYYSLKYDDSFTKVKKRFIDLKNLGKMIGK